MKIFKDVFWRLFQTLLKQGYLIIFSFYFASVYNISVYSEFAFKSNIYSMAVAVADMGLSVLVLRYILKRKYNIYDIFYSSLLVSFISALIIIFTMLFFYDLDRVGSIIAVVFTTLIISILDGVSRARDDIKYFSKFNSIVYFVAILFSFFIFVVDNKYKPELIFIILALSQILIIVKFIIFYELYKEITINLTLSKTLVKSGFVISLATIGSNLYVRSNLLYFDTIGESNWLAYLDLFEKIFFILVFPVAILGQVLSKNSIVKHSKNNILNFKKVIWLYVISYIPIFILFLIVSYFITGLIFKDNIDYLLPLILFTFSVPLRLVNTYVIQSLLYPLGKEMIVMFTLVVFGVGNIFLTRFFFTFFGIEGVFTTTSLMILLSIICQLYIINRNKI